MKPIHGLGKDELPDATRILMDAQGAGHAWTQDTWDELWTRRGLADPRGCLALAQEGKVLTTKNDFRTSTMPRFESTVQYSTKACA